MIPSSTRLALATSLSWTWTASRWLWNLEMLRIRANWKLIKLTIITMQNLYTFGQGLIVGSFLGMWLSSRWLLVKSKKGQDKWQKTDWMYCLVECDRMWHKNDRDVSGSGSGKSEKWRSSTHKASFLPLLPVFCAKLYHKTFSWTISEIQSYAFS